MKVYEAVANAFVKEGTDTVFGLLGDGQLRWWPAMARRPGMKIVHARHEDAALAMAEGWARASGRVGVCTVTQGPGVSRMTTSLIVASRSRTPLVVFTSKTGFNNEHAEHYLDQERLVSATGAGYIEVLTPDFAEDGVRQAFYRARLESRPVVLCVPMDIQGRECDAEGDDYQPSSTLFDGQQRIRPSLDRVEAAVKLIAGSKKPVLILGRGASSPGAIAAAERLAGRIGALIATTLQAKGALARDEFHAGISGLFSRRAVMKLYEEADCVIALGASLNPYTLQGGLLYPHARIVQVDVAPHVLMGTQKGADCYVQGDAELTAAAIEERLAKDGVSREGFRVPAVRRVLRDAERDPGEFEIEPGTLDPREVVKVIDDRLPADVGLVIGAGHCFSFPAMGLKKPRALEVYCSAFGCIGQALPTTIGVGMALNGAPVAHIEGDGGAMQSIQELDTAARMGLRILFMIFNDEGFGAEYHKLRARNEEPGLGLIPSPQFRDVGRVFGCRGKLARSLDEVAAGIDEFLSGEGPMVMDIRISRNVVSIPYQRTQFGADV
jgi:thiamine pyrophosphate-dependent acetolactate synthase large subunit-like protein